MTIMDTDVHTHGELQHFPWCVEEVLTQLLH